MDNEQEIKKKADGSSEAIKTKARKLYRNEEDAITINQYAELQGYELYPWQSEAANAFLDALAKQNRGAEGKSFLVKLLMNFIREYPVVFNVKNGRALWKEEKTNG